jgi:hypothetical protein
VATAGVAAAVYGAVALVTWRGYGSPPPPKPEEHDEDLDRFMPVYDIVERHHIRINASADTTFAAACDVDLMRSPINRAIFRTRGAMLGGQSDMRPGGTGLLAWAQSLGWGVLADRPGREIVMGAVTKPWEADVVFRALPPREFAAFDTPGFVKIVWTLRADPIGLNRSVFRTETRAVATDTMARARFRRYWSLLKPGIVTIRWMMLRPLKEDAESRERAMLEATV